MSDKQLLGSISGSIRRNFLAALLLLLSRNFLDNRTICAVSENSDCSLLARVPPWPKRPRGPPCGSISTPNRWVVYATPPWGSPEQVLKYLSRYTYRVAIANSRLVFVGNGVMRFRYPDYAAQGTTKIMELQAAEFLRRFLLHVVPTGFVRIRHYGLLANRARQEKLTRARHLLAIGAATPLLSPVSVPPTDTRPSPTIAVRCPLCARTHWRIIARLLPQRGLPP